MALQARWALDNKAGYKPSLVDYSNWELGKSGSQYGWSQNGTTDENAIILKENPLGVNDIMWATEQNRIDSSSDGGFNSATHEIDRTKPYRISCWLRRENAVEALGSGSTYFGVRGYTGSSHTGLINSTGTINKNPYFTAHSIEVYGVTNDNWFLYVGYVYPSTHNYATDTSYSDGGIWTLGGTKIYGNSSFKFSDTNDRLMMRSYLYYSTKTDERMYWYRPRIDVVDGTEPSVDDLLNLRENPNIYTYIPNLVTNKYNLLHGNSYMTIEDGKIGQCHRFHSSSISRLFVKDFMVGKKIRDFTVTTFVKFISGGNTSLNCILSLASNTGDNRLGFFYYANNKYIEFQINGHTSQNISLDLSQYSNKWIHLTGRRTNGVLEVFVNGVKSDGSKTNSTTIDFGTTNQLAIGSEQDGINSAFNVGQSLNGCLNDLRFYDHSLSKKEIRDISQGKILHYNFNNFQQPRVNLWGDTSSGRVLANVDSSGLLSYGTTAETYNGNFVESVIKSAGSVSAHSSYRTCIHDTTSDDRLSISWKVKVISGSIDSVGLHYGGGTGATTYEKKVGDWYHFRKSGNGISPVLCAGVGFVGTDAGEFLITEPMLEKYTDHDEYFGGATSGTVVDSSGLGNHAELELDSTPRWVEDSRLGGGAYYFNDNEQIFKNIYTPEHITMSTWIKSGVAGDSAFQIPMAIHASHFELTIGSSGYIRTGFVINGGRKVYNSGTGLLDDEWHMVTSTYDGSYIRAYIDGQKTGEWEHIGTLTRGLLPLRIGTYSGVDIRYRSKELTQDDVRIYATALSDEDVFMLYKSRSNLDKNGNLSTNEVKIDGTSSTGVNKKGQLVATDVSEVGITDGLHAYYDWSVSSESLEGGRIPTAIVNDGDLVGDVVKSTGVEGEYIKLDTAYDASVTNEETIVMVAKKATSGNAILFSSRAWARRFYTNDSGVAFHLYLVDENGGSNTLHAVESPYNYSDKNFFAMSYGNSTMKVYDENGKNPVLRDIVTDATYLHDIDFILLGRWSGGSNTIYYENEWYKLKIFNRQLTDKEVAIERKALMDDEKAFITKGGTVHAHNFKEVN